MNGFQNPQVYLGLTCSGKSYPQGWWPEGSQSVLLRLLFLTLAFLFKKTFLLVEKFDCHLVEFFLRDSLAYRDEQARVEYRLVGELMQSTKVLHVGTLSDNLNGLGITQVKLGLNNH